MSEIIGKLFQDASSLAGNQGARVKTQIRTAQKQADTATTEFDKLKTKAAERGRQERALSSAIGNRNKAQLKVRQQQQMVTETDRATKELTQKEKIYQESRDASEKLWDNYVKLQKEIYEHKSFLFNVLQKKISETPKEKWGSEIMGLTPQDFSNPVKTQKELLEKIAKMETSKEKYILKTMMYILLLFLAVSSTRSKKFMEAAEAEHKSGDLPAQFVYAKNEVKGVIQREITENKETRQDEKNTLLRDVDKIIEQAMKNLLPSLSKEVRADPGDDSEGERGGVPLVGDLFSDLKSETAEGICIGHQHGKKASLNYSTTVSLGEEIPKFFKHPAFEIAVDDEEDKSNTEGEGGEERTAEMDETADAPSKEIRKATAKVDGSDESKLFVKCPEGASPGDTVSFENLKDGEELHVTVPDGVVPGQEFEVDIKKDESGGGGRRKRKTTKRRKTLKKRRKSLKRRRKSSKKRRKSSKRKRKTRRR